MLWQPDAGTPPARGQLFQRSGGDFGLDFGGGVWLTRTLFLALMGQKKLRAEKSKDASATRGFVSPIALKLHYEATTRKVLQAMHGRKDGVMVIPLLCAITNLPLGKEAAGELRKAEEEAGRLGGGATPRGDGAISTPHCPAHAFRKGLALDWTTPVEELVEPDRKGEGAAQELKWPQGSFVKKFGSAKDRKDKPGNWKLAVEGGWEHTENKAVEVSLIPKGGLALLTTKETMKAVWPVEVLALAQEFDLTCFGAGETEEEKRAMQTALRARPPASVWESARTLRTEAEEAAEEEAERKREEAKQEAERKREEAKQEAERKRKEANERDAENSISDVGLKVDAVRQAAGRMTLAGLFATPDEHWKSLMSDLRAEEQWSILEIRRLDEARAEYLARRSATCKARH